MRRDEALLLDMLIAARKVRRFSSGMSLAEFMTNDLVQSAVIRELQVIGEAARRLSPQVKAQAAEIDWAEIAGMRNRLIHEYFGIRLSLVWETAAVDIPSLISALELLTPPDLTGESTST